MVPKIAAGNWALILASRTRGSFLESPGNFSGPKSNIQIEIQRIRARVLASKLLHFVSLTDSFIMLDAKLLKPRSLIKRRQLTGPVNCRNFRETSPSSGPALQCEKFVELLIALLRRRYVFLIL